MNLKLQIMSTFWGKKHTDLFIRGTLKSLAFDSNREALQGSTWNIFTDEDSFKEVGELAKSLMGHVKICLRPMSQIRDRTDYLHAALCWQIKRCLETGDKMLLAPPDTIWGDGSIEGILKVGIEPKTCVYIPHPRVLSDLLCRSYTTNDTLVSASWDHLHRSWSEAETNHPMQNSWIGGVHWRKISKDLYAVQHRLPTPYLCDFTKDDLDFFETCPGFGMFDHVWSGMLVQQGRARLIASSDAAFVVEVTDKDKNVPPIVTGSDQFGFWQETKAGHEHNKFFKQTICIMRGAYHVG